TRPNSFNLQSAPVHTSFKLGHSGVLDRRQLQLCTASASLDILCSASCGGIARKYCLPQKQSILTERINYWIQCEIGRQVCRPILLMGDCSLVAGSLPFQVLFLYYFDDPLFTIA